MNFQLLIKLIDDKGFSIYSLSKKIGMSHVGLSKSIKKNSITVLTLEKIAEVLGVSPSIFFDEQEPDEQTNSKGILDYIDTAVASLTYVINELDADHLEQKRRDFWCENYLNSADKTKKSELIADEALAEFDKRFNLILKK